MIISSNDINVNTLTPFFLYRKMIVCKGEGYMKYAKRERFTYINATMYMHYLSKHYAF